MIMQEDMAPEANKTEDNMDLPVDDASTSTDDTSTESTDEAPVENEGSNEGSEEI